MNVKNGGCACATCCHSASVAGSSPAPNSTFCTQENVTFAALFGFSAPSPEQAVLTGYGIWPEPPSYRGLNRVREAYPTLEAV